MEKMRSKTSIQRNWSDLPGDLLGLIILRLSSFDLFSFIWVCSSWHAAAKAIYKGKSFPVLVLSDALQPKEVSTSTQSKTPDCSNPYITRIGNNVCFFSIKDKQEYSLRNPQNFCSNYTKIVGSHPDGWLVMLDEFQHPYLLKLIPQIHQIELPEILLRPNGKFKKHMWWNKAIISVSNPSHHKDDFLMVIMMYDEHKLAFWRHGANEWTGLKGQSYSDVAFCGDDKLFALKVVGTSRDVSVVAWKLSTISSDLPVRMFSFEVFFMSGGECYYHSLRSMVKLVVSPVNDEILILSYGGRYRDPDFKWSIFKVDFDELSCIQINSLNGQALLLDRCSSIFVSSTDVEHHGYKPNSIYYVSWWERNDHIKLENLNIEDGEIVSIWDSPASKYIGSCWIAPTI